MRTKYVNFVWGLLLIVGGGLFLADNLGYLNLDILSPLVWAGIFGAASLMFLALYLASGVQKWGLLFPVSVFAGIALTIYLAEATNANAAVGAPVLLSIAVPFAVAFGLDTRRHWWALIPAWVMTVLTLITLVVDRVSGELIGSLFMFAIALPFLAVYLYNRTRRWALIPAFAMSALAVIPLLANSVAGELIGAYVTMMIAVPFFIVYLWSPEELVGLDPGRLHGHHRYWPGGVSARPRRDRTSGMDGGPAVPGLGPDLRGAVAASPQPTDRLGRLSCPGFRPGQPAGLLPG